MVSFQIHSFFVRIFEFDFEYTKQLNNLNIFSYSLKKVINHWQL